MALHFNDTNSKIIIYSQAPAGNLKEIIKKKQKPETCCNHNNQISVWNRANSSPCYIRSVSFILWASLLRLPSSHTSTPQGSSAHRYVLAAVGTRWFFVEKWLIMFTWQRRWKVFTWPKRCLSSHMGFLLRGAKIQVNSNMSYRKKWSQEPTQMISTEGVTPFVIVSGVIRK